eukprot:GGOE01033212.1.p1 GENE.GGOE01033212.1~~GGOE01033212.1.p1  ORF type:complete len:451 (-),score=113.54 GGOE01033212.1:1464-2816(-)
MGSIDASTAKATKDTDDKRGDSAIVLGVAMAVAATLPMSIGLWLGNRLLQLGRGMDCIAKLDFRRLSFPEARFRELHDFQQSFQKMERGLRAFGKFVPSAVVMRLVAGHIHTDDNMETSTITVMFADIENFSTFAETLGAAQLAEVCTEYFEVMCRHVVASDGTIDKFIGDCIMAIWNAPQPKPDHERSAVTAVLRMQAEILGLHAGWQHRNLPALKFRAGIHTGICLVGNFGCSHRINYTCLGDNVILASRLETLNKKFGTALCVSQSTYAGCKDTFQFRHLSKVLVSGRSEALSVYEVLCSGRQEDRELDSPSHQQGCSPVPLFRPRSMEGEVRLKSLERPPSSPDLPLEPFSDDEDPPDSVSFSTSEDDALFIPYHWSYCNRSAVLREAAAYEAAATALLEGRYRECREYLAAQCRLDKSWQLLEAQLDQQIGSATPWDGAFHFLEK